MGERVLTNESTEMKSIHARMRLSFYKLFLERILVCYVRSAIRSDPCLKMLIWFRSVRYSLEYGGVANVKSVTREAERLELEALFSS